MNRNRKIKTFQLAVSTAAAKPFNSLAVRIKSDTIIFSSALNKELVFLFV